MLGTIVGVLPGIGPLGGITILLPTTFGMEPVSAIIMLAGIYYGAMYGGSTTSILVNIPGEAASVVTCFDGYQMARKGRAGPALSIAAARLLRRRHPQRRRPDAARARRWPACALKFGPPEQFALMVLGLVDRSPTWARDRCCKVDDDDRRSGSLVAHGRHRPRCPASRASLTAAPTSGTASASSPSPWACSASPRSWSTSREIVARGHQAEALGAPAHARGLEALGRAHPSRLGVGFLIGILPGAAHIISTFVSYAMEKRLSQHPEEFGTGAHRGRGRPRGGEQRGHRRRMIPFLALGIPSSPATATMMVALLIHGVKPGPILMEQHPEVFWGLIASMYVGNVMLLILNLPLVGLFINLLRVPAALSSSRRSC